MGSTLSTAHRLEIRRALYLTPSNKKIGVVIRGYLRRFARLKNAHLPRVNSAFSVFDKSPNLTPSNKKMGVAIRGHLRRFEHV